jgi:4-amino-4-deoxy-L-arabinose transferase-like glycosyltransferase
MSMQRFAAVRLARWQTGLLFLIMLAGFGLRAWMIAAHLARPITMYDDRYYIESAKRLLDAGIFTFGYDINLPTVFIPPVFPLYLAGVFAVFGSGDLGLTVAQYSFALMGTTIIALIVMLGAWIGRPGAGLIGGTLYALYPPAMLSNIVFLTETIFTMELLAFFVLVVRAIQRQRRVDFVWAGVVLGVATLTRPTIALVPAVIGIYLWARPEYRFAKALQAGVILVVTMLLVLSPWIVRNYVHFHQFIPLTKANGNPFLTGTYIDNDVYREGNDPVFTDLPKGWKRVPGNQIATNDLQMEIGKAHLKAELQKHPGEVIKWYTIGKFRKFWGQPFDWRDTLKPDYDRLIPLHKALILLGGVGMVFALLRRMPYAWLFVLFLGYFTGLHMVYVTLPRYALPVLPFVFLFIGLFATGWGRRVTDRY